MSMPQNGSNGVTTPDARRQAQRAWYRRALARYTSARRQELGLSVARAAELAGLEISEWDALESGWAPDNVNTIRAIAATLEVDWEDYNTWVFVAWGYQQAR